MRSLTVLTLLAGLALPLGATEQVSVKDLAMKLANSHSHQDGRLARELYNLRLTERLSTARLVALEAGLPGEESRHALLALADSSAFLNLPAADISAAPPLDAAAQQELIQRAIGYLKKEMPLWPDFMATQKEIQFSDAPAKTPKKSTKEPDDRLHIVYESSATVRFLGGKEELSPGPMVGKTAAPARATLAVQGVFGPIFSVALKDVLVSRPSWNHWESGVAGPMAVFQYRVPQDSSHYVVQDSENQGILAPVAAYHGQIGIDPSTGAILRLTLIAEQRPNSPVARADILIEYSPQKLGGKSYICPKKSVAVSLARDEVPLEGLYTYPISSLPPFKLELNDTDYADYHLFRTEMHILPAGAPADGPAPPPAHPQR